MTEITTELADVDEDTTRLSPALIQAIKTEEGLLGGENFARLSPIKFGTETLRQQYIGVGGWTEDSQAIEICKAQALGDNQHWFHPASGSRLRH